MPKTYLKMPKNYLKVGIPEDTYIPRLKRLSDRYGVSPATMARFIVMDFLNSKDYLSKTTIKGDK